MTLLPAQTAWLIPLYPLIAALLSLAWSPGLISRTGPRPSGYLNLVMALLAMLAFHSRAGSGMEPIHFHWQWLSTAGLSIDFAASVTGAALVAMLVVTGLQVLSQIYAIGYLEMDGAGLAFSVPSIFSRPASVHWRLRIPSSSVM